MNTYVDEFTKNSDDKRSSTESHSTSFFTMKEHNISHSGALCSAVLASKAQPSNLKSFSFSDLKNATRNFRSDSLLGEGGFGYVFKGWIDEQTFAPCRPGTGLVVAVKKLKAESVQGHREWLVCFPFFLLVFEFINIWCCNGLMILFILGLCLCLIGRGELFGASAPPESSEADRVLFGVGEEASRVRVHAERELGEPSV